VIIIFMLEFSALDGAILVDKPSARRRMMSWTPSARKFGIKKVGHCGTLDPNATGLLIIVLGRGYEIVRTPDGR